MGATWAADCGTVLHLTVETFPHLCSVRHLSAFTYQDNRPQTSQSHGTLQKLKVLSSIHVENLFTLNWRRISPNKSHLSVFFHTERKQEHYYLFHWQVFFFFTQAKQNTTTPSGNVLSSGCSSSGSVWSRLTFWDQLDRIDNTHR